MEPTREIRVTQHGQVFYVKHYSWEELVANGLIHNPGEGIVYTTKPIRLPCPYKQPR